MSGGTFTLILTSPLDAVVSFVLPPGEKASGSPELIGRMVVPKVGLVVFGKTHISILCRESKLQFRTRQVRCLVTIQIKLPPLRQIPNKFIN
jgi:hypothetical protein